MTDVAATETRWSGTTGGAGDGGARPAWMGALDDVPLPTLLGWFSVGLGTLELVAPRRTARMIGLSPNPTRTTVIQAMGLREIAHGVGILTHPQSTAWVGSRIGGDVLDLALLGVAMAKSDRPQRTLMAAAAVLGAGMLDVLGTRRVASQDATVGAAQVH